MHIGMHASGENSTFTFVHHCALLAGPQHVRGNIITMNASAKQDLAVGNVQVRRGRYDGFRPSQMPKHEHADEASKTQHED